MPPCGNSGFRPSALKLYELLLKPAAAQLKGKTNLLIVPDDQLWNLPFQALLTPSNRFLLEDQLRGKWGFKGYVVSDCDAVVNISRDHHYVKTRAEGSAVAVQRGMDNECNTYQKMYDDSDYHSYIDAVQQGFLKESDSLFDGPVYFSPELPRPYLADLAAELRTRPGYAVQVNRADHFYQEAAV